jgi:hypothetical protein
MDQVDTSGVKVSVQLGGHLHQCVAQSDGIPIHCEVVESVPWTQKPVLQGLDCACPAMSAHIPNLDADTDFSVDAANHHQNDRSLAPPLLVP